MNGSTENTAHGAPESPERREVLINLTTARSMLPLVGRIVGDIVHNHQILVELLPQEEQLHRQRRDLTWPERQRRYRIQEEIAAADRSYQEALTELAGLGLVLVDSTEGRVGFPTMVNSRRALFSWRRGEEDVQYWHFPEETVRRKIPSSWVSEADMSFAGAKS
jgi:hypothetical protein